MVPAFGVPVFGTLVFGVLFIGVLVLGVPVWVPGPYFTFFIITCFLLFNLIT